MGNLIARQLKRLFQFTYETELDVATCRERLTDKYRELAEAGENPPRIKHYDRRNIFFKSLKNGTIRAVVTYVYTSYTFRLQLVLAQGKTLIVATNINPFGPVLVILPLAPVLMLLATPILVLAFHANLTGLLNMALGFFLVTSPFYAMPFIQVVLARSLLKDYLEKALDAKPHR